MSELLRQFIAQNSRDGKREDWEHEEERQDDDVDMEGEEAEDGDAVPAPSQYAACLPVGLLRTICGMLVLTAKQ